MLTQILLCTLLCTYLPTCSSFVSPRSTTVSTPASLIGIQSSPTRLYAQFDMSKPTFDLLSFRAIRSDALMRYNNLNQSEPLRINLYLLATISLLGYPLWGESVTGDVPTLIPTIGSIAVGIGTTALFWRERTRRSNQLYRMEKELMAQDLEVRIPVNKAISSTRPTASLKELKSKRRILAIRGSKEQLSDVWDALCILRRRLVQSQTLVVLVSTDSSKKEDWGYDTKQLGNALWLAEPLNVDEWVNYFNELLDVGQIPELSSDNKLAWFALNFMGKSVASGLGDASWLELLGRQFLPMELLDETDKAEISNDVPEAKQVLECQQKFYNVLTSSSDANDMATVFSDSQAEEVNQVINEGGRVDGWDKCLEPDARPVGMTIASSDVWMASNEIAYSTCIEFPPNAGIDGATLLAVQRWRKAEGGGWKLQLHQTIPWSVVSIVYLYVH